MSSILRKIHFLLIRNKRNISNTRVNGNCTLEWWNEETNVGDGLAPVVFDWMLEKKHIKKDHYKGHIMTIGSLVGMGAADSVIWGTGLMNSVNFMRLVKYKSIIKYDIRAVRGPLTRDAFLCAGYDCPELYGDPGVLMPYIYMPMVAVKKYGISLINHHSNSKSNVSGIHEISVDTYDYQFFIDEILASKKIISSSLHGIIIAESYGIPAVFLNEGDAVIKQSMKYLDWYYSTGRYNVKIASSVEEAVNMVPMDLPKLSNMQESLLKSFPYDLFN